MRGTIKVLRISGRLRKNSSCTEGRLVDEPTLRLALQAIGVLIGHVHDRRLVAAGRHGIESQ